ncbi:hypothetical protein ACHQM5_019064 [Ranunculus cassubicifolius]
MSANLYLFFLLFCFRLTSAEVDIIAKPGCKDKCGSVSIPYPFGIGSSCSIDRWAEVKCDTTFNPPKLFFTHSIPHQVVEFTVANIIDVNEAFPSVRIKHNISKICSDGSGAITSRYDSFLHLNNTPFYLYNFNQFHVLGCYMYGVIRSGDSEKMSWGCTTVCDKIEYPVQEQCNIGSGCCQMSPPDTPRQYSIHVEALNVSGLTHTRCGSAFLTDEPEEYMFKASDIQSLKDTTVKLIFIMENQSCEEARKDPSSFACKKNSQCINTNNGYFCACEGGHKGNPYLDPGCVSWQECNDVQKRTCKYKCTKSRIDDYYCTGEPSSSSSPFKWIILGAGLGLFLFGGGVWMYYRKRKQLLKISEKLVQLNARLLLIQEISSHSKIFTAKRLESATNNFHESRILGQGGFGTVYKGILPNQSIVAVKKSKYIQKSQFDDFINEVAILTKIDHRNIVKLLGCSVETEHPLLVYEFVSNGTLSDHIFKKSVRPYSSMSWDNRLRIAAEIAGALAYLHSAASKPIIHRDIKSSNILLDDHFTAKVADFGLSRVNHLDQTEIGTLVKGTPGYLDPEYIRTSKLTEKSDVFSYGVVLAELLTGKKSISFERSQGERNLAIYFNASMNKERLLHIVEEGMVSEENMKEVQAVAALVQRCVNFKGDERPSMKEVESELEALREFSKKNISSQKHNEGGKIKGNLYPTSIFNDGASGSSVAELTMSVMVAR